MNELKIGVLIHGYHLQAEGWENMVWGKPEEGVWGSIPQGVEYAFRHNAALISWGTGASQKDGVVESQYMFNFALAHSADLALLCGCSTEKLEKFLKERSHVDLVTQNTVEEIKAFLDFALQNAVTEVALVAIATHSPRSLKTALSIILMDNKYASFRHHISHVPADTSFAGASVGDVAIVEPPHRGDMPKWQTYKYIGAIFQILKQGDAAFEAFLTEFGELLKRYGVEVTWPPKV